MTVISDEKDLQNIFRKDTNGAIIFHYNFKTKKSFFELRIDSDMYKRDFYKFSEVKLPVILKTAHKDIYSFFKEDENSNYICWSSKYIKIKEAIFTEEVSFDSVGVTGILHLDNNKNEYYFIRQDGTKFDIRIEQLSFILSEDYKWEFDKE